MINKEWGKEEWNIFGLRFWRNWIWRLNNGSKWIRINKKLGVKFSFEIITWFWI